VGRVPRLRLYEQIVQQLYEHISSAGLRPGDRLPPERELAASLGVSRASLAQALVALEVLGVISVRHGDGVVVMEHPRDGQIISALRLHRDRSRDVMDARAALEVKLASLAAQRRTDSDLRAIDEALASMAADIDMGGRGEEGGERFHAAVTEAGKSPLLSRLMQEISDLIRETHFESLGQPGRPAVSLAGHQRVAAAIRQRDAAGAAAAMEAHLHVVGDVGDDPNSGDGGGHDEVHG
jgi:GntR family transcriptional repressor for pyruvate dehydrogenase complex